MKSQAWLLAAVAGLTVAGVGCEQAEHLGAAGATRVRELVRPTRMERPSGQHASKAAAVRGNRFTGEIRFTVTRPGDAETTVVYTVKEGKVRYDLLDSHEQSAAFAVADLPTRKAFAVLPDTGSVIYFSHISGPGDPPASLDDAVTLRRPGEVEHVAGRLCEIWEISTADHDVDACATSGISWFELLPPWSADHAQPRWAAELSRDRYFPLRLTVRDKTGREQLRMLATQVRKGPVEDACFEPPVGQLTLACGS